LKGGTLRLQKQRELAVQKQNKGKLRDQWSYIGKLGACKDAPVLKSGSSVYK
jgi:hypothetical protein